MLCYQENKVRLTGMGDRKRRLDHTQFRPFGSFAGDLNNNNKIWGPRSSTRHAGAAHRVACSVSRSKGLDLRTSFSAPHVPGKPLKGQGETKEREHVKSQKAKGNLEKEKLNRSLKKYCRVQGQRHLKRDYTNSSKGTSSPSPER